MLFPGYRQCRSQIKLADPLSSLAKDAIYDPDDYAAAQHFGYALRGANSFGIHYQSVRAKGECYGVLRPKALSEAIHWHYLRYHYEQGAIVEVEALNGTSSGSRQR